VFKNLFFFHFILMLFSGAVLANDFDSEPNHASYYIGAEVGTDGHAFPFNVFGGYGKTVGESANYYLGWEATAYAVPAHNGTASLYGIGLSFIPGIWLTPTTLGYLRAGALVAKLNSPNQTHIGDQFGLGLQFQLTKNCDLRSEYIFREYNSLHNIDTSHTIDSNEVDFGLVYKF